MRRHTGYDGKKSYLQTRWMQFHSHFSTSNLFSWCLKNHLRFFRRWQWVLSTLWAHAFWGPASKSYMRCKSHSLSSYLHFALGGRTYTLIYVIKCWINLLSRFIYIKCALSFLLCSLCGNVRSIRIQIRCVCAPLCFLSVCGIFLLSFAPRCFSIERRERVGQQPKKITLLSPKEIWMNEYAKMY